MPCCTVYLKENNNMFEHGCFSFCLDIMLSVDFLILFMRKSTDKITCLLRFIQFPNYYMM